MPDPVTTATHRGHKIEIVSPEGGIEALAARPEGLPPAVEGRAPEEVTEDILLIDDEEVPYLATPEGFQVWYQPPKPTLMEAAESYLDTQPEVE